MELGKYFSSVQGTGFLGTASGNGEVDLAIYSRPRVMHDGTLAFGMTDRLTHANLRENPHAIYAFSEKGYEGRRIYMKKIREEEEGDLLEEIRANADRIVGPGTGKAVKFVVYFEVKKILPLVE